MTLVVAHRIGGYPYIVSDTKPSPQNQSHVPFHAGLLKSLIVTPELCISFAGNTHTAENAVLEFKASGISDRDETRTVDFFKGVHSQTPNDIQFILAFGKPGFRVVEMRDGMTSEKDFAWIGSPRAYNSFQGHMLGKLHHAPSFLNTVTWSAVALPASVGEDPGPGMLMSSMTQVIGTSEHPEVGFLPILVAYGEQGYHYATYSQIYTGVLNLPTSSDWHDIDFGTAATGGCALSVATSTESHEAVLAYYLQGRCGILFRRCNSGLIRGQLLPSMGPIDLFEYLKKEYELSFPSGFVTHEQYYNRGAGRLRAGNFVDALSDFMMSIRMDRQHTFWRSVSARGYCFAKLGQFDQAIADFTLAITLKPSEPSTYLFRAKAFLAIRQPNPAINDLDRTLSLDPTNTEAADEKQRACRLRELLTGRCN
jgi:hypothetical protein